MPATESTPSQITNMTMPASVTEATATEPEAVAEATEGGDELTAIGALANQSEDKPVELTDAEKLEIEVKAEAEKRAAEEAERAKEERQKKFERAKAIADRERAKVAEKRKLQMEAQRAHQERQQLAQQLAFERQRAAQMEEVFNQFRADPAGHLEKMGVTAETIAKKALEENTPETRVARLEQQLQTEREERQKALAELAARERAAQEAAAIESGRRVFLKETSDADRWPVLAKIASVMPDMLIEEAEATLHKAARKGIQVVDDDIREVLEEKYARIYGLSTSNETANKSNVAPTATLTEKKTGSGTPVKPVAGVPQTLTSRANTRAVAPPPLDELDDATAKRVMAEQYRLKKRAGG